MSKTAKKLIALITLICSVISSVPVIAAEQTVYIENTEDLKELSKNCSLDSWSRGVNVVLKNNINVAEADLLRYLYSAETLTGADIQSAVFP